LQKCFIELFGLQLSFKNDYEYFEAGFDNNGFPVIRLNSAWGCSLILSSTDPFYAIKMMRYGSDEKTETRNLDENGVVVLSGGERTNINYYFGEVGLAI
jgi:hypothetical protein